MTRDEAIKVLERAEGYIGIHYINGVEDPYINPCLLKAIDFAVAALREQEERRWIPVTERLPDENNRWVLCLCVSGAIEVLKFDCTMWNWDAQYPGRCYMENYVIHWMPLPEPPKGE